LYYDVGMSLYPIPRSRKELEKIRARIRRDYEELSVKYSIPVELHFAEILKAVSVGMVPTTDYPYRKLQIALMDTLARHKISIEEMNEALGIISAVWNYFPHHDMGMSPVEKMAEQIPERHDERFDADRMAAMMAAAVDEIISLLGRITRGILAIHMKKFGFRKKHIDAVADILESPKIDPAHALIYLLKEAVALARKSTKKYLIDDLQPTVRALAAYENHAASKMSNGHFNSRMFQNIVEQHMTLTAETLDEDSEERVIEFVNPAAYLESIFETHRLISETGGGIRASLPLQEAAHHILDWVGLLDIRECIRLDPKSFALLILAVAHRISKTGDPEGPLGCSEKRIRALLINEFADATALENEIVRISQVVLCGCSEPDLMIADVVNAPEDCEERLAVLAPCLKLRSPVNPADLPVPSPFSL